MKTILIEQLSFCLILLGANISYAQTENKYDFDRIEDNSFLLEEAYNQEPGVIQHISAFQYMDNKTWVYSFTEEWPAPRQKHQLSVTVLVLKTEKTGFGDLALNYRYQAVFTDRLAFSPRFSLIFPTGDYTTSAGSGAVGYQANLPVSFILTPKIVTHYNFGSTYIPGAKSTDNSKSDLTNFNYGASVIVLLSKNFNFMLEVAGNTLLNKKTNADTETTNTLLINPGFRFAINCKSGLQIVPGIAVPIGVGSSSGTYGIFAYLSFEHPLWEPKK
jgi:hypothetical protein